MTSFCARIITFYLVTVVVLWIALDQVAIQADPRSSFARRPAKWFDRKRSEKMYVKRLLPGEPYDSKSCPNQVNCVEVASPEMWKNKSAAKSCTPGGYTCTFPPGSTVTTECPNDGSTGTVKFNPNNTPNKGSHSIEYSGQNKSISGTFGGDNSETHSEGGSWASAYMDCVRYRDPKQLNQ